MSTTARQRQERSQVRPAAEAELRPAALDRPSHHLRVFAIEGEPSARVDLPCAVCGGDRARAKFRLEGQPWRVVTCDRCGTGRLDPPPAAEDLGRFYTDSYYGDAGRKFTAFVEWAVRFVAARHARFLSRRVPAGGRVLDIGCGRGTLLSALADSGFEVHGFEISSAAAMGADPRSEIRIASEVAEARYPADHFDLVILWHVLEHLRDPRRTLEEVHRVLRPGGRVAIAVPNFSSWQARWAGPAWFHLDPPRHLYHFPVAALRTFLRSCGFEPDAEHHFSLRQNPYGWVQSWLNTRARWPRNALYDLLKRGDRGAPSVGLATGIELMACFALGMPLALVIDTLATAARSGATVDIVGRAVK